MKNYSKELSFRLRHKPDDLEMDEYGWVLIEKLLNKIEGLSKEELLKIVKENNKQRFSISEDDLSIKANQGHSIPIKFELSPSKPPRFLYHGTSYDAFKTIKDEGLKKMNRHHVHLTDNVATAIEVGKRYAKQINLVRSIKINAELMFIDGIIFYCTENHVWLTDYVDPKYFIKNTSLI
jgi:putative RNA 2'-phosphotransferase